MTRSLSLWTIYDHPSDFPKCYVAREFLITAGAHRPTHNVLLSTDLQLLRGVMEKLNLTAIERWPEDDPKIIEVWL